MRHNEYFWRRGDLAPGICTGQQYEVFFSTRSCLVSNNFYDDQLTTNVSQPRRHKAVKQFKYQLYFLACSQRNFAQKKPPISFPRPYNCLTASNSKITQEICLKFHTGKFCSKFSTHYCFAPNHSTPTDA